MRNPKTAALISTVCTLAASVAIACNVPVFRYALERWPADPYELVILHEGELSQESLAQIKELKNADSRAKKPANFSVRTMEMSAVQDRLLRELWKYPEYAIMLSPSVSTKSARIKPYVDVEYQRNENVP